MKKILIGCGVIVLLVVIGVIAVGYFGFQFAKNMGEDFKEMQATLTVLNEEFPFYEPSDGLIQPMQFNNWLTVREGVQPSITAFDSLFEDFSLGSIGKLKGHLNGLIDNMAHSLRSVGMSPDEYFWISKQMYATIQSGDVRYDNSLSELYEALDESKHQRDGREFETNIDDWDTTVTADQIRQNVPYLRSEKAALLSTMSVFYADAILSSIGDEFPFGGKDDEEEADF